MRQRELDGSCVGCVPTVIRASVRHAMAPLARSAPEMAQPAPRRPAGRPRT